MLKIKILTMLLQNQNDLEDNYSYEITNIYNNYYNKNDKLKNKLKNDFLIHQEEIVKRILNLAKNNKHLEIAFIFAKQLI
jgi:hypothetical protein